MADDPSSEVVSRPARVEKVHIVGVGRTKNDILVQAVQDLLDCRTFNEVLLRCTDVRRNLEVLDAFKQIDIGLDTTKGANADPNGYEVTFKVKETRRVTGGVHTLVGNNEGSVVVGAKLPNVGGRGEIIQAEYQYGTKHSSCFNVTASKPILGKRNIRLSAAVYQQAADYPWNAFRECNRGLLAEVSFKSLPDVHHAIRWEGVWRELNPLGITVPFPVREQMGHSLKSAVKHILSMDTRDNGILPTQGYFLQLCSEFAGGKLGGDISFIKNEVEHQMNVSLFSDLVLQIGTSAGYMTDSGNHNICDKFFLGGPLGLRGFQLRGVGPQTERASLGGNTYWSTACHLYSPLPFRKGKGFLGDYLRIHGFVAAGSICKGFDADVLQDPRLSAGIGLVLSVNHIARVELNYVVPIKHKNTDRTNTGIQLGVGVSFL